jgi:serine/threonine protein kinase
MKGEYKYSDTVVVSNEAKNLLDLLLKNDPNERISLDDALKHDWFKILSNPRKK